jgi:hypothetical protein
MEIRATLTAVAAIAFLPRAKKVLDMGDTSRLLDSAGAQKRLPLITRVFSFVRSFTRLVTKSGGGAVLGGGWARKR